MSYSYSFEQFSLICSLHTRYRAYLVRHHYHLFSSIMQNLGQSLFTILKVLCLVSALSKNCLQNLLSLLSLQILLLDYISLQGPGQCFLPAWKPLLLVCY